MLIFESPLTRLMLSPDTAFSLEKKEVELPQVFQQGKKVIGININATSADIRFVIIKNIKTNTIANPSSANM